MGVSFVRRFTFDPGADVLLNIESVDILDLDPPAAISGVGTGVVNIVGEFENGPFNSSTEVAGSTDLGTTFGSLGYVINGVSGQYACAVQRNADAALAAEYWNGNGAIQLNGKQFASLLVTRVDTSVGLVQFTPNAYVTGATAFRYVLGNGQILSLDVGSGATSATFSATAATVTSGAQTFNTSFAGGETLVLGYDGAPNFTVTFLSTDQTQAQVISRINSYAGFAFAASVTGTTMSLTGIQKGNQAQVRVVSGSGTVLTVLGLSAATTFGTGNVADVSAVTPQEVISIVQAAISGTRVELDQNGALRISATAGTVSSFVRVTSATTAANLGFVSGQSGTYLGVAAVFGIGASFPTTTSGTFSMSYDGNNPFTVTVATSQSAATVITNINTAAGATIAYADGTQIVLLGRAPGGSINVISASAAAVVTQLGFGFGNVAGVALPFGAIPAGTVVQNSTASNVFVTMQDVRFTSGGVTIGGVTQATLGPWSVKVRHATDNGTGISAGAGTLTSVPGAVQLLSVAATNPQATAAALSESAIDAAYTTAIAATADINTVAKTTNIIYSARQSNTVRRQLRLNAISASANGATGRVAVIRPPLGTTRAAAKASAAEPGVGAYRDQRVIYCYPGASTFVPIIGRRGVAGGAGYTASGNVDVGADGFMASILSQLPPEEDPGQATSFTGGVVALETSTNAAGFVMEDYIAFKAAGIAALRIDDGIAFFQSGVTSVDPLLYPQLVNISRRRMADYIQGSLASRLVGFGKKLSTVNRRAACLAETRAFMDGLLSRGSPANQRIAGFTLHAKNNSPAQIGQGLYRITLSARTLNSLKAIVLETTVGEQVQVVEQIAA